MLPLPFVSMNLHEDIQYELISELLYTSMYRRNEQKCPSYKVNLPSDLELHIISVM